METTLDYGEILKRLVGDTSFHGETYADDRALKNLYDVETILWWALWQFTEKAPLQDRPEGSANSQFVYAHNVLEAVRDTVQEFFEDVEETNE